MIKQSHEIPLTTAITKSAPGRGSLVQQLYVECEKLFKNEGSSTKNITRTRLKSANHVTAIVTDDPSGLFVQMTGVVDAKGHAVEGPWLTFGKKFLEESKNAQLSNTCVRLW